MHERLSQALARFELPADVTNEILTLVAEASPSMQARLTAFIDTYEPVQLDTLSPDATVHDSAAPRVPGRYRDLGLLGEGGMAQVRRVLDLELNRAVAMKIVRPNLTTRPRALARFVEEAQATAQLQHPNIVPVHDAGLLPDGRAYFTMKVIEGLPLSMVLQDAHEGMGWSFRRLVAAFLSVCQAVAYAHDHGVVHRDLKPDNIVVGDHGSVYVVDWGLAKVLGRRDLVVESGDLPVGLSEDERQALLTSGGSMVVTDRAASGSHLTRAGTVTGTPVYMAPEQARGEIDRIDARSDVYGLGATLYELLSGRRPFAGGDVVEVVAKVSVGLRTPLQSGRFPIPDALREACDRAMALDPADRFSSAAELAKHVEDWLDGARRREQALAIALKAMEGSNEAADLRERAWELRARGDAMLAGIEPWQPQEDKAAGWARQDEADALERRADLAELAVDQGLQAALRVDGGLVEAHAALALRYKERHAAAEADRDLDRAAQMESLLRVHAEALPVHHPARIECIDWLLGEGKLSLITDPPGATVVLYRYAEVERRLVPVEPEILGTTPLREVELPMGRYLCRIEHPDRAEVLYPVEIPRLGHWDGVAPGDSEPTPVWLPPSVEEDEIYVPAGWFHAGGDGEAVNSGPARRLWCDALVVQRFSVTNRQYIAFLDALVARGETERALRLAPRERPETVGSEGRLIYGFDGEHFELRPDGDGDVWDPDWPVLMVDWEGARTYMAWLAEATGKPWRLPAELEWEKAARGVDGRAFPWGDRHDPSWCCMISSHRGRRLPTVADTHPVDTSPTGVHGMAGNVSDWCGERFDGPRALVGRRVAAPDPNPELAEGDLIVARGGSWLLTERSNRCANRLRYEPHTRNPGLGFRGVYRPQG